MYYCYNLKNLYREEEIHAKELNQYLFYDEDNDEFYDRDGKIIDICNKTIFVRSGIFHYKSLLMAVRRHGGVTLTSMEDMEKINLWQNYIRTERKIFTVKGRELLSNPLYWKTILPHQVLLKIKEKNICGNVLLDEIYDKSNPLFKLLSKYQNYNFILSDFIDILKDEYGTLEFRVFVLGGKVLNISRKSDTLLCQIDDRVVSYIQKIVSDFKQNNFSLNYSLDVFVTKNGIDILECNPIEASGTYLYNSVFLKEYDLYHTNPQKSIPQEKKDHMIFEEENTIFDNSFIKEKTLFLK